MTPPRTRPPPAPPDRRSRQGANTLQESRSTRQGHSAPPIRPLHQPPSRPRRTARQPARRTPRDRPGETPGNRPGQGPRNPREQPRSHRVAPSRRPRKTPGNRPGTAAEYHGSGHPRANATQDMGVGARGGTRCMLVLAVVAGESGANPELSRNGVRSAQTAPVSPKTCPQYARARTGAVVDTSGSRGLDRWTLRGVPARPLPCRGRRTPVRAPVPSPGPRRVRESST